jgi:Outer membrane protein beta-barrel domain
MPHTATIALVAGLLLTALPIDARAQEERLHVSFGAGFTAPNSEVRDQLGDGYNFAFGVQFDVTPVIGIQALLSTNDLGDKRLPIPVSLTPTLLSIPTDFIVSMSMQFATANLVVQKPEGSIRPYGLVGAGIYDRPAHVTTNGAGWVREYCDPWWYVCYSGGFVPVTNIVGERSSTDFGMALGAGANFGGTFFAEVRYHHIWGPTIEATQVDSLFATPTPRKVNGQFIASTVGIRF